jgi:hypothetical protein
MIHPGTNKTWLVNKWTTHTEDEQYFLASWTLVMVSVIMKRLHAVAHHRLYKLSKVLCKLIDHQTRLWSRGVIAYRYLQRFWWKTWTCNMSGTCHSSHSVLGVPKAHLTEN